MNAIKKLSILKTNNLDDKWLFDEVLWENEFRRFTVKPGSRESFAMVV